MTNPPPAQAPPELISKEAPVISGKVLALGILGMAGSVAAFAAMQMFVKLIGPDYSPFQAVFFRNGIAALIILPIMIRTAGLASLKTDKPVGHITRSLSGVIGNASFFYAYSLIALSDGMSIAMAVPIFTTLLAIPFLGEKVGLRRWTAIFIGFAGVLIALDPSGDFQTGSLFALLGTVCWAFSLIMIKKLSASESPFLIVFYYMMTGVVISAVILPFVWVTPTFEHLMLYIAAGVVGGLGQLLMTYAMKVAPAAVVTPFEYSSICWAVGFDLAVWGVSPDAATLLGAGIVIATGLYIWHRETRVLGKT